MNTATAVFVLIALFVTCMGEDNDDKCITENCEKLPRSSMPNIELVASQPPMYFIYSLNHNFDCAIVANIKAPSGTNCYSGKSHITPTNSTDLQVMAFTFCDDNQPCLNAIDSKTGLQQTWYIWDYEYTEQSSWVCSYSCREDGEKFQEFACIATNDDKLDKIQKIVKEARQCICNGRYIHDARKGCPEVNVCPLN